MAYTHITKGMARALACWLLAFGQPLAAAPADSKAAETAPIKEGKPTEAAAPEAAPTETTPPVVDTAPPAPIRNPPQRLEVKRNQPLAKQIEGMEGAEGNAVWLGDEKDPFLGLYVESYEGEPLGAVLLLHDNEQHPNWPGMLRELRLSFPKHGWSTMSIALPDFRPIPPMLPPLPKPAPVVAQAPEEGADKGADNTNEDKKAKDDKAKSEKVSDKKDAAKKETSSKEANKKVDGKDKPNEKTDDKPVEDNASTEEASAKPPATPPAPEYLQKDAEIPVDKYPEEIEKRIKEATRYLINEGVQHVVIVAFGSNAGLATHISRKMLINELDGLVLMDPKPYPEARFDLPKDTADLRIPILDVVPEFEAATNPLLRKQSTGRMQTPHYEMRLVRGAAVNFSGYEPYVFKAVRGWVDTQFRNAPTRKDRKMQAQKKRAEKAATPVNTPTAPSPTAPPAPSKPPPKGSTPNLNEAIPPPIPE